MNNLNEMSDLPHLIEIRGSRPGGQFCFKTSHCTSGALVPGVGGRVAAVGTLATGIGALLTRVVGARVMIAGYRKQLKVSRNCFYCSGGS